MPETPVVDTGILRNQVREKNRAVAVDPDATYRFHTGRPLAGRYQEERVEVVREIERHVIGADWGANGYTTIAQADRLTDASIGRDGFARRGWRRRAGESATTYVGVGGERHRTLP